MCACGGRERERGVGKVIAVGTRNLLGILFSLRTLLAVCQSSDTRPHGSLASGSKKLRTPGLTMVDNVRFQTGFHVGGGQGMLVFVKHGPVCEEHSGISKERIRATTCRAPQRERAPFALVAACTLTLVITIIDVATGAVALQCKPICTFCQENK